MGLDDFNKDLEALGMPTEELSSSTPPGSSATPTPVGTPIKAGGREFKDSAELANSYNSLLKEFTKRSQAAARGKELEDFQSYLAKHPQLRDNLSRQIDEYHKQLNAGATNREAQQAAGLSNQQMQQIQAQQQQVQARLDDIELEREMTSLRSKYNLDDAQIQKVLKESYDNEGITLEKAYRIVTADEAMAKQKADSDRLKALSAKGKVDASVGSSTVGNIRPSAKSAAKMSEAELRQNAANRLEQFGITEA